MSDFKFKAGQPVWVEVVPELSEAGAIHLNGVIFDSKVTFGKNFYCVLVDTYEGEMFVQECNLSMRVVGRGSHARLRSCSTHERLNFDS